MNRFVAIGSTAIAAVAFSACGDSASSGTDSVKSQLSQSASSIASTVSQSATEASGAKKNADGSFSKTCKVTGLKNVDPTTVQVGVTAKGNGAAVGSFIACPSATAVVQVVSRLQAEKPIKTGPFTCTPVVTGTKAAFTCSLTASDAVTATYKFTLNYKG